MSRLTNYCPAIGRFIGFIGFGIFGWGSFYLFSRAFNFGLVSWQAMGAKGGFFLLVSIVIGIIGLLIGQGIGFSIKIRNDNLAEIINGMWHYLANGSIIWFLLSIIALSITIGRDNMKLLFSPENFLVPIIIIYLIAAVGSEVTYLCMLFSGNVGLHYDRAVGDFFSRILPIVTGIAMGVVQFKGFGLPTIGGIIIGFIFPYIFIPITAHTRRKDMALREKYKYGG